MATSLHQNHTNKQAKTVQAWLRASGWKKSSHISGFVDPKKEWRYPQIQTQEWTPNFTQPGAALVVFNEKCSLTTAHALTHIPAVSVVLYPPTCEQGQNRTPSPSFSTALTTTYSATVCVNKISKKDTLPSAQPQHASTGVTTAMVRYFTSLLKIVIICNSLLISVQTISFFFFSLKKKTEKEKNR